MIKGLYWNKGLFPNYKDDVIVLEYENKENVHEY